MAKIKSDNIKHHCTIQSAGNCTVSAISVTIPLFESRLCPELQQGVDRKLTHGLMVAYQFGQMYFCILLDNR
ncbi:hypothetical protein M5X06_07410 [Paenibacillus alvei]|uniref:Uncharacterized protein n=1 Tax=Paenibacillus alvei TaxID=44250 RepID=A0ABT4GRH3_PAEAL|nr:hypothetical protein [Paenibacillus alvei]MCY9759274.1 hypothetical protein [Paenibacillus alvei]MCY9766659.1 hypothetical protein [Paenibacillus alvei]